MKKPETPPDWRKIFSEDTQIYKLINDKDVFQFITECNKNYIHWDKLRRLPIPKNIAPEKIWALIKFLRSDKSLRFNFDGFNFKYTITSDASKKLHFLDKEAAGNLQIDDRVIYKTGQERYIISALMEEAIASSQLEGAVTTRKIAKEMLRQNRKPKTDSEKMILNGYKTLKMILERKKEKLSKEFILDIQKSITEDTLKEKRDEGMFRDNNDVVVGDTLDIDAVYHVPPDYNKIPYLIEELCQFANSNNEDEFIHPIVKAIFLHFLIGYIHPFNDGNGRTARAIFYWYVITQGYWLFEYTPISRKFLSSRVDYGLSYLHSETDENDLTYFIEFNLKAIYQALIDMQNYINKKKKEQTEVNQMVGKLKKITIRQAGIIKEFMQELNKYFTIKEIQGTYHIAYETARNDLMELSKKKYITMTKIKNKYVFVITKKNLSKIDEDIDKV